VNTHEIMANAPQNDSQSLRPRFLGLAALVLLALNAFGCENAQSRSDDACQKLADARTSLSRKLDELEEIPRAIPKDIVQYGDRAESELQRFSNLIVETSTELDALQESNEVACKWQMMEENRFDDAMESVYAPYVELVSRQRRAVDAVADRLESGAPKEVVGDAVRAYRNLSAQMAQNLRSQVEICELDFDVEPCEAFGALIATSIDSPPKKVEEPRP